MKVKRRGFLQRTLTAFIAVALDILPSMGLGTKDKEGPKLTPAEDDSHALEIVEIDYKNQTVEYNRRINREEESPVVNLLRRGSKAKVILPEGVAAENLTRCAVFQHRAKFACITKEGDRYVYAKSVLEPFTKYIDVEGERRLQEYAWKVHEYPGLEEALEKKNLEIYV